MVDYANKPYAAWVDDTIIRMFDVDPVSIAMEMRDKNGMTYTCYWNTSQDDRSCMIGAMKEDWLLDFVRNNKELLREIVDEED